MTGAEVVTYEPAELAPTSTLFGTDNPAEVVERAAAVAKTLADLVRRQKLIVRIGQSEHVRVEGWTLLGSMLGVFPVVEWTRPVRDTTEASPVLGWEARVVAKTRGGETVGAAEAECLRSERTWGGRDDYALRSMAQTRAVSKALRLPLGFVMQLAGFDPTPADEMPATVVEGERRASPSATVEPVLDDVGTTPPAGTEKMATAAKKKKLDVLVKGEKRATVRRVWVTVAAMRGIPSDLLDWFIGQYEGAVDEAGVLHWSPLRDSLTDAEASQLIDRLEKLEPAS